MRSFSSGTTRGRGQIIETLMDFSNAQVKVELVMVRSDACEDHQHVMKCRHPMLDCNHEQCRSPVPPFRPSPPRPLKPASRDRLWLAATTRRLTTNMPRWSATWRQQRAADLGEPCKRSHDLCVTFRLQKAACALHEPSVERGISHTATWSKRLEPIGVRKMGFVQFEIISEHAEYSTAAAEREYER